MIFLNKVNLIMLLFHSRIIYILNKLFNFCFLNCRQTQWECNIGVGELQDGCTWMRIWVGHYHLVFWTLTIRHKDFNVLWMIVITFSMIVITLLCVFLYYYRILIVKFIYVTNPPTQPKPPQPARVGLGWVMFFE